MESKMGDAADRMKVGTAALKLSVDIVLLAEKFESEKRFIEEL